MGLFLGLAAVQLGAAGLAACRVGQPALGTYVPGRIWGGLRVCRQAVHGSQSVHLSCPFSTGPNCCPIPTRTDAPQVMSGKHGCSTGEVQHVLYCLEQLDRIMIEEGVIYSCC